MRPLLLLLPLQLVQEFRLLLLLGRTLCHKHPGVSMTCTRLVQRRAADGSISERQVDLMFPATERTVLRLMQAWWDRKVGARGAWVAHQCVARSCCCACRRGCTAMAPSIKSTHSCRPAWVHSVFVSA
jgi:hypothetical protein